jgi:signal transduction histidine kinase
VRHDRRAAPRSAARTTLRRLRWLLTAVFTAVNALGLLLFAWLAVRSDAQQGRQRLDGELQRVTLAAIQRLGFQADAVSLSDLAASGLSLQCPGFAVLPGGAEPFLGLQSQGNCVSAPLSTLNQVATAATRGNRIVSVDGSAGHRRVRMLAEPFYHGKAVVGAVVATVDAQPEADRHRGVVFLTGLGCTILILGLAGLGHLVSGGAIRPAASTLDQQELFLAESAHDLRTPVAALRALAETALDRPDQRGELLPRTVALAQRMGSIIDDLLIRARLAAGVEHLNRQPIRLDQLVAGVIDNTPADGGQITVQATASTVSADPTLVQRAVGNLLDNALKYGRWPGQPAFIDVTVTGARVIVSDHGPGMTASLSPTPFGSSSGGAAGSTGLGLSIVRWIAEAHDGSLTVHNGPDGGAVFELTLGPG